jgi:hypothetical protein
MNEGQFGRATAVVLLEVGRRSMEVYQPEDLDLIDEAFEQTWATLLEDRSRNSANDEELKRFIRDKLLTLASAGIHDVEMMRTMVLASLLTWTPSSPEAI